MDTARFLTENSLQWKRTSFWWGRHSEKNQRKQHSAAFGEEKSGSTAHGRQLTASATTQQTPALRSVRQSAAGARRVRRRAGRGIHRRGSRQATSSPSGFGWWLAFSFPPQGNALCSVPGRKPKRRGVCGHHPATTQPGTGAPHTRTPLRGDSDTGRCQHHCPAAVYDP